MKHLCLFDDEASFNSEKENLIEPFVVLLNNTKKIIYKNINSEDLFPTIPNDEIWYSTINGNPIGYENKLKDSWKTKRGPKFVSEVWDNDEQYYRIKFESEITAVGTYAGNDLYSAFNGDKNLETVILPGSLTNIYNDAFLNCSGLTSINIPDSVTRISDYAFSGCGIKKIKIHGNTTKIGTRSFANCLNLTNVTIKDGVKTIDEGAFYDCTNLSGLTIPNTITSIGDFAFNGCSSLVNITYEGTVAEWNRVSKGYRWCYNSPSIGTVVTCTDGEVRV